MWHCEPLYVGEDSAWDGCRTQTTGDSWYLVQELKVWLEPEHVQ